MVAGSAELRAALREAVAERARADQRAEAVSEKLALYSSRAHELADSAASNSIAVDADSAYSCAADSVAGEGHV